MPKQAQNASNGENKEKDAGSAPSAPKPAGRGPVPQGRQAGAVKTATNAPLSGGVSDKSDLALTGDALRTKEIMDKEPKVSYIIPLQIGERKGAYETASINGYKLTIQKGVRVMIPEPFAKLLDEMLGIQETVGQDMRVDRNKDVQDALL